MPYIWFDEDFNETGRLDDWPASDGIWEVSTRDLSENWETLVLFPTVCFARRRHPASPEGVYLLMWRET